MNAGNRYAVNRFLLKTVGLSAATILRVREGAWGVASVLFLLASALDACIALGRHDRWRTPSLTYWDEAVAFLVLGGIAASIEIGSLK